MTFKVFISHSTENAAMVKQIAEFLRTSGIDAYVSEWYLQPGAILPNKVATLINQSDCVIALMTTEGDRSEWVHQEIGYAKKANKIIIPVIEEGVIPTGFLIGIEYVRFKRDEPLDAINRLARYLKDLATRKEEEERGKKILAGLAIFFGLLGLAALAKRR